MNENIKSIYDVNTNIKENDNITKIKSNKKYYLITLIIVIIIAIVGFILYFKTLSKKYYIGFLNNIVLKQEEYSKVEGNIKFSPIISTDDGIYDKLNNYTINLDYGIDYDNKFINLYLNTLFNNNSIFDANLFIENNDLYLLIKDIYNDYLKYEDESINNIFNKNDINSEFIKYINLFKKSLIDSLKNSYFKTEIEGLYRKNILILDEENIKEIIKNTYINIMEDKKIKNTINENSYIKQLDNIKIDNNIDIVVYTGLLNNDFKKLEIVFKENGFKFLIVKDNDTYNISYVFDAQDLILQLGSIKVENITNGKKIYINIGYDKNIIGFNLEYTNKINSNIEKTEIKNYKNINDLTNLEKEDIINQIKKKFVINKIDNNSLKEELKFMEEDKSIIINLPENYSLIYKSENGSMKSFYNNDIDITYKFINYYKDENEYIDNLKLKKELYEKNYEDVKLTDLLNIEYNGIKYSYKIMNYSLTLSDSKKEYNKYFLISKIENQYLIIEIDSNNILDENSLKTLLSIEK